MIKKKHCVAAETARIAVIATEQASLGIIKSESAQKNIAAAYKAKHRSLPANSRDVRCFFYH